MRRFFSLGAVAAVLLASSTSFANITLTVTPETINSTLAANGWSGYLLTLTADSTSGKITSVDLKNNVAGGPQGSIGIQGQIHQAWTLDYTNTGNELPTPSSTAIPGNANLRRDSFFFVPSYGYLSTPDAFTENNNGLNGTNPPYNVSPLTDVPGDPAGGTANGIDFGVGSSMTFSGAIAASNAQSSLDLAFIIVPTNGTTTVRGVALDPQGGIFPINTTIGTAVPEPASIGLLAFGASALLARRKRR